jgi:hypothetical protein
MIFIRMNRNVQYQIDFMKKILFITLLTTLTYALQAQVHADWGVKAGLNLANLKIENTSSPDSKVAVFAGLLAHLHFEQHWAVQPEIMYSNQGAKQDISGTEYKVKLHYINLPVLLQYMTGSGFRLQTGPQLGILAAAKTKAGESQTDANNLYKTFDLAWVLGASYVTNGGFGIDARYNIGLANINDQGGSSVKNRVWQFGLFYQFKVSSSTHRHIK